MDPDVSRSSSDPNFEFAFNESNFSDRILRIEIMADPIGIRSDADGCGSVENWVSQRKRRREEVDMKKVVNLEHILICNPPDTEDCVTYDNHDEAVVMINESALAADFVVVNLEDILSCNPPDTKDIVAYDNHDEVVSMIEESPSGAEPSESIDSSWNMVCSPAPSVKSIFICSAILAAKSPFFYKLFSNGMQESDQHHVTLRINASEEAALMELLSFMYSGKLSSDSPALLLDVLMAADKFEVSSCMKHCSQLLRTSAMSPESALLYLELPCSIPMASAIQPLTDAAKKFLAEKYRDITKYQEEVMNLPIAGIEAILSSDDLQIASEDVVYDLLLKWAHQQYPKEAERREIIATRLGRLIRYPHMTCRKLRKVLTCNDLDHKTASKAVLDALFFKAEAPHRKRALTNSDSDSGRRFAERAYKYRPVKLVEFELPHPQCVVYLELRRKECERLYPSGRVYSQAFHLGRQGFFLSCHCNGDQQSSFHCFGLFLGMQEKGSGSFTVEYEFAARTKPLEEFVSKFKGTFTFTGGKAVGYRNLFAVPWSAFMAEDSPFFINGVLYLRAELTVKQPQLQH